MTGLLNNFLHRIKESQVKLQNFEQDYELFYSPIQIQPSFFEHLEEQEHRFHRNQEASSYIEKLTR